MNEIKYTTFRPRWMRNISPEDAEILSNFPGNCGASEDQMVMQKPTRPGFFWYYDEVTHRRSVVEVINVTYDLQGHVVAVHSPLAFHDPGGTIRSVMATNDFHWGPEIDPYEFRVANVELKEGKVELVSLPVVNQPPKQTFGESGDISFPDEPGMYLWYISDLHAYEVGSCHVVKANGRLLEHLAQLPPARKTQYLYYSKAGESLVMYFDSERHLPPKDSNGKPLVDGFRIFWI